VLGAGVTGGGGAGDGVHDSDSERTGSLTGNDRFANGVPGGTSMVKGICTPPSSVTVTTHGSADAGGSQNRAVTTPTVASVTNSRRHLGRARASAGEGVPHTRFMA
jgi:hypothetical protein